LAKEAKLPDISNMVIVEEEVEEDSDSDEEIIRSQLFLKNSMRRSVVKDLQGKYLEDINIFERYLKMFDLIGKNGRSYKIKCLCSR
jgi:hypothetical protein